MRKTLIGLTAALLGVSLFAGAAAQATDPGRTAGVWRNPKNNVHIRIAPCGSNVCGTVVWASRHARAKARSGGTAELVGTQVMRDFRQIGPNNWSGRVFVPDIGRTVSGTMRTSGSNALIARGCLIAGLVCRAQTWTRIG